MKDKKTQEFLRIWGKEDVPFAIVTDGAIRPANYATFALLGWVQNRTGKWPVVLLRLAILRHTRDKAIASLVLVMPFNPKTERHVCCLLQDFGWDGRIWPHKDQGWPEGTSEESQLIDLLRKGDLGATFTFPPHPDKGIPLINIPIMKRTAPFPVAPFGDVTVPRHLDILRSFVTDPTPFKSDWKK